MSRLKIGIVGCGEVTQTVHLPTLMKLREQFEVVALCDVSETVRTGVGRSLPDATLHADHESLLAVAKVDAILVANPHALHAEVALAAIARGKHVLIEKPMCMTLEEADSLEAAASAAGSIVQVGYMRRYAPAFIEAVRLVASQRDKVRFARFNDIIGNNSAIVNSTSQVIRGDDLPPAAGARVRVIETASLDAMHGATTPPFANVFSMLLGLGSHDLSAMRELLGVPQATLHATQRSDGRYLTAAFDYGHFVAEFVAGVDNLPRYETYFEIFTDDQVIRVDYDTPYVLNLPARLTVTTADGEAGISSQAGFPTRQDSFEVEWLQFHDSISTGRAPKTSIADAREDLLLIRDMMSAMA